MRALCGKRILLALVLIFKLGIFYGPEPVVAMRLAAEADRSCDAEFISVPDIPDNKYLPSMRGCKIQSMQHYSASQRRPWDRESVIEIKNSVSTSRQKSGGWSEGNGGFAKYFPSNGQSGIIVYSIYSICYGCGRSPDVGNRNNTFDPHAICNRNGRYTTQHTVERYSTDTQTWPVRGNEGSITKSDRLSRKASLTAGGDPEHKSECRYGDGGNSGDRSIVRVKETSKIDEDLTQVADRRYFISGLIFIVGCTFIAIFLVWSL